MIKYLFVLLMTIHGIIHFMGFAKAFEYAEMKQLTISISKPIGMLWLLSALLFLISAILFLSKKRLMGNNFHSSSNSISAYHRF